MLPYWQQPRLKLQIVMEYIMIYNNHAGVSYFSYSYSLSSVVEKIFTSFSDKNDILPTVFCLFSKEGIYEQG